MLRVLDSFEVLKFMMTRDYPTVAERNFVASNGRSLLHIVTMIWPKEKLPCVKFEELVSFLVEARIDPNIRDKQGLRAIDYIPPSSPFFEAFSRILKTSTKKGVGSSADSGNVNNSASSTSSSGKNAQASAATQPKVSNSRATRKSPKSKSKTASQDASSEAAATGSSTSRSPAKSEAAAVGDMKTGTGAPSPPQECR